MYNFKIKKIITNDKSEIEPKKINVIIGPNNCGKSRFLKDIRNYLLRNNNPNGNELIVIDSIELDLPTDYDEFANKYKLNDRLFRTDDNQYYFRNYSGINNNSFHTHNSFNNYLDTGKINVYGDWEKDLKAQISIFSKNKIYTDKKEFPENSTVHHITYVEYQGNDGQIVGKELGRTSGPFYEYDDCINQFINRYGPLFVNYLGTEEKLLMCKKQTKYGFQDGNTNFLSEVQLNFDILKKLSDHTKFLFNRDVYLDRHSWGSEIVFRVGDNFDFIRTADRENSDVELKLKDYNILDDEGDGLKSFITNFLALNINDKNILLLDEPESFLHPPLARQLGKIIGESATDDKQIFISTHSADLLRGIMSSGCELNIIRITRNGDINDINQITRAEINSIIMDPSLSSGDILAGLFSEKVYISEAENDEEFYQFLHDKVNLLDTAFFTHAKNKQTICDVAKVYNNLKIPNIGIYDFDILYDDSYKKIIPKSYGNNEHRECVELIKKIKADLKDNKKFKDGGVEAISDSKLKEEMLKLIADLKSKGIILLKRGCLETSLVEFGVPYTEGGKKNWLSDAIDCMNKLTTEELENSYIYKWIFQ